MSFETVIRISTSPYAEEGKNNSEFLAKRKKWLGSLVNCCCDLGVQCMGAVHQPGPAARLPWMKSSWSALESADRKMWAKPNMCLLLVFSLMLASVRCSIITKYSSLVCIKAVKGCRLTSDGDLFSCWQKKVHFFTSTGSNRALYFCSKCRNSYVHKRKSFQIINKTRRGLLVRLLDHFSTCWLSQWHRLGYAVFSSLLYQICTFLFHLKPWF